MKRRLLPAVILFAVIPATHADDSKPTAGAKTDALHLAGTWLFDAAIVRDNEQVGRFWTSTATVCGDAFVVSSFMGLSKDLKGKIVLNPASTPNTIDLNLDEFDLAAAGAGVKISIPAGTLPGIYKFEGERLIICFNQELGGQRPTKFDASGDKIARVTLVKAPAGFKEFPKEVAVKVAGPDGKPVAGATVASFMSLHENRENKNAKREWQFYQSAKTAADGTAKLKYEDGGTFIARDPDGRCVAVAIASPASLVGGSLRLSLRPECRVSGTIVCEQLKKAGKPIGWTNVYAIRDGVRFAACDSSDGKFEFVLPPGTYSLNANGSDLRGQHVTVTVPEGRSEFVCDPVALTASRLALLKGRPAPELDGIIGWKGTPVKLADLKGKYVLLNFTGYWCGPCMQSMPIFIELHEKFAARGLTIIGVHVDIDGEVDTAAKLDEKLAIYRKDLWHGKDVPFPMALTSGKQVGDGDEKSRGRAAAQYGVMGYPTDILIDRDGKVVGRLHARGAKMAFEEIEKLLNAKK